MDHPLVLASVAAVTGLTLVVTIGIMSKGLSDFSSCHLHLHLQLCLVLSCFVLSYLALSRVVFCLLVFCFVLSGYCLWVWSGLVLSSTCLRLVLSWLCVALSLSCLSLSLTSFDLSYFVVGPKRAFAELLSLFIEPLYTTILLLRLCKSTTCLVLSCFVLPCPVLSCLIVFYLVLFGF